MADMDRGAADDQGTIEGLAHDEDLPPGPVSRGTQGRERQDSDDHGALPEPTAASPLLGVAVIPWAGGWLDTIRALAGDGRRTHHIFTSLGTELLILPEAEHPRYADDPDFVLATRSLCVLDERATEAIHVPMRLPRYYFPLFVAVSDALRLEVSTLAGRCVMGPWDTRHRIMVELLAARNLEAGCVCPAQHVSFLPAGPAVGSRHTSRATKYPSPAWIQSSGLLQCTMAFQPLSPLGAAPELADLYLGLTAVQVLLSLWNPVRGQPDVHSHPFWQPHGNSCSRQAAAFDILRDYGFPALAAAFQGFQATVREPDQEPYPAYRSLVDAFLQRQLARLLQALAPFAQRRAICPHDSLAWWVTILESLAALSAHCFSDGPPSWKNLFPHAELERIQPRMEEVSQVIRQVVDGYALVLGALVDMTIPSAARLLAIHMWDPSADAARLARAVLFSPAIPTSITEEWITLASRLLL